VVHGSPTAHYSISWGEEFRQYSAAQLEAGVNLAEEFPRNPFNAAFAKVDAAVAAKQAFETRQVKQLFHGPEGRANIEETVARTEAERARLVKAIQDAFVPVTHTIKISAE
jgi:hypothetical protein